MLFPLSGILCKTIRLLFIVALISHGLAGAQTLSSQIKEQARQQDQPQNQKLVAKLQKAVGYIRSQDRSCMALLVEADLVLSAWSCVNKMRPITFHWHQTDEDNEYPAKIVAINESSNLVALQVPEFKDRAPVEILAPGADLVRRQKLIAIGSSLHSPFLFSDEEPALIVSTAELLNFKNNELTILFPNGDAVAGSALFDEKGMLVGVNFNWSFVTEDYLGKTRDRTRLLAMKERAKNRKIQSVVHADSFFNLDLRYENDPLLNELTDSKSWRYSVGFSFDVWDRVRLGYNKTFTGEGARSGFDVGYKFAFEHLDLIPIVGRNRYEGGGQDSYENKLGFQLDFSLLELAVFTVQSEDKNYTSFSVGF